MGRKDEATEMFERLLALRNDVGLLSEEYDPRNRRMLGNFPQALSHIALAHAAFTLSGQWTAGNLPDSHVAAARVQPRPRGSDSIVQSGLQARNSPAR